MVRHVIPLERELLSGGRQFAGRKELRDAEHLLKSARVVPRRRQKILEDLMVPAEGQIDVLHVLGRLTIDNSADKKLRGLFKGGLRVNQCVR